MGCDCFKKSAAFSNVLKLRHGKGQHDIGNCSLSISTVVERIGLVCRGKLESLTSLIPSDEDAMATFELELVWGRAGRVSWVRE